MGHRIRQPFRTVLFATAFALVAPCSTGASAQNVGQFNLVTDNNAFLTGLGFSPAVTQDPNLINPWGMSFSPTGPFWISNQGSNTSTLYTGDGIPAPLVPGPLVVNIPAPNAPPSGPTGQAFTGSSGFTMGVGGSTAIFSFANLDGTISAWNPSGGTNATVVANNDGAVYTGLAVASTGGSTNYLYAANNAGGTIDVFDQTFAPHSFGAGAFVDPTLPSGLSPFNVANIAGQLFVTYAAGGPDADEQALGTGAVSIFMPDGTFVGRFATGSLSGGDIDSLVSPWGVTVAPANFGLLGGDILIGNFSDEDGFINIFDPSGNFLGLLMAGNDPFNMPYLWSLSTRTGGVGVDPNSVYLTAGIGDEEHGLFAQLFAVPEPSTWSMMLIGFGAIGLAFRRTRPKPEQLA